MTEPSSQKPEGSIEEPELPEGFSRIAAAWRAGGAGAADETDVLRAPEGTTGPWPPPPVGQRSPDDSEVALGRAALAEGLLTSETLEQLLAELSAAADGAPVTLAQLLIQRRLIDGARLSRLMKRARAGSTRVGRYELQGEIARGGMGVVYRARDPQLQRTIALKVIRQDRDAAALAERFQREAVVAGGLSHPGIITIHDVGVADGPDGQPAHYIAMDLVEGPTLDESWQAQPLEARVDLLREVCEAVGHAHRQGVLHRDLKPGNVLIAPTGRAVVTDFGLARGPGDATLTVEGEALGTPHYMAPEQALGRIRTLDPRTDVWALGVMLYQMLVGRLPFLAESIPELLAVVVAQEPVPPRQLAPLVPGELEAICLKALEKSPRHRYDDASAMAADLRRWQSGEDVLARPTPWAVRWARRLLRRKGLLAVLLLCLVGGAWGGTWLAGRASSGRAFAEHRERALGAARRGAWRESVDAARQALRERPGDAQMQRVLQEALRVENERKGAGQRQQQRAAALAALRQQLSPIAQRLDGARHRFYLAGIRIEETLLLIRAQVQALEALSRRPPNDEAPGLWALLGRARLLLGDRRGAERDLKRALALGAQPGSVARALGLIHLRRAMAWMTGGVRLKLPDWSSRSRQALREARRWLERAPEPTGTEAAVQRAVLAVYKHLAGRETEQARSLARSSLERLGEALGTEELWLVIAFLDRRGPAAVRACDQALARCPHHAWALMLRGYRLEASESEARIRSFQRATRIDPYLTAAWLGLGDERGRQGSWAEAERCYGRALAADSGSVYARYNRAAALRRLGKPKRAIADLDALLKLAPDYVPAINNRATLLASIGQVERAIAEYTRALRLAPEDVTLYLNRGAWLRRTGKYVAALSDFDAALRLLPGSVGAWMGRARVLRRQARYAPAVTAYTRALALDPRTPDAHRERGICHQELGQLQQALADYQQAIALRPGDALAHARRGMIHGRLGRADRSLADFEKAIALDPRQALGYLGRGRIRQLQGREELALRDFEKAIGLEPTMPAPYQWRGLIHERHRRYPQALADYDTAIRLAPREASAYLRRGVVHLQRKALDRSSADLEMAAKLAPKLWQAWFRLGQVALLRKQKQRALDLLARAARLAPKSKQALIRQLRQRAEALD